MDSTLITSLVIQISLHLPVVLVLSSGLVLSIISLKKNPQKYGLISIAFLILIVRVFIDALFTVLYGVNHLPSAIADNVQIEAAFFTLNKLILSIGWALLLIPLFIPKLNPAVRSEEVEHGS